MADKNSPLESPPILAATLVLIVMVFATVAWFGARPQMAMLYAWIRDIQTLFLLSDYVPYGYQFDQHAIARGYVPEFSAIYKNSFFYGLLTTVMTLGVMVVAMTRLSRNNIKKDVIIGSPYGRTYKDVLERYADIEPSARFFYDYDVLDLPTNMGTARQNYTAMELLFYTGALRGVTLHSGRENELDIDRDVLKEWFKSRFGGQNPFYGMTNDKLVDVEKIEAAVDKLAWYELLVLYPAMLRIYGFHVEEGEDGFKATNNKVDAFISGTWAEMNRFKKLYGNGITLGFADDVDRAERVERYRNESRKGKKGKKGERDSAEAQALAVSGGVGEIVGVATGETKPFTNTAAISAFRMLYEKGEQERKAAFAALSGTDLIKTDAQAVAGTINAIVEGATGGGTKAKRVTPLVAAGMARGATTARAGAPQLPYRVADLNPEHMQDFTAEKPGKMEKPEDLLFFGEVLSRYAAEGYLKSVEEARQKLKDLLKSHLTQTTGLYPVGTEKDGTVRFSTYIKDNEQQAFNQKAQRRLNEFALAAEKVLMRHAYSFGVIGAALTEARRSGIMPPNLFRWMRFCEETTPMWWFVHNVGMPSSVPENAGLFEHFQVEQAAGCAIAKPYVDQAITGIKDEAERYLTKEMVDEIREILGRDAVLQAMVKKGRAEQSVIEETIGRFFDQKNEGGAGAKGDDAPAKDALEDIWDD